MPLKDLSGKKDHNWVLIEANKITAKKYAKEHCPYIIDGVNDCTDHSSMRLKAYDTHLELCVIYSKKVPKNTLCSSLSYERSEYEFYNKMVRAFNFMRNKLKQVAT